jgi:hypothetical protein
MEYTPEETADYLNGDSKRIEAWGRTQDRIILMFLSIGESSRAHDYLKRGEQVREWLRIKGAVHLLH